MITPFGAVNAFQFFTEPLLEGGDRFQDLIVMIQSCDVFVEIPRPGSTAA
jgi:hypothetical protein